MRAMRSGVTKSGTVLILGWAMAVGVMPMGCGSILGIHDVPAPDDGATDGTTSEANEGSTGPDGSSDGSTESSAALDSASTSETSTVADTGSADGHAPEAGVTEAVAGGGFESKLTRLENALAQRDFIYLLVFLALVDCVYEFLWAAAIGGLLYFAVIQYLRRVNEHEQARQPHPAR